MCLFLILFAVWQAKSETPESEANRFKSAVEKRLLNKKFLLRKSYNVAGTMYLNVGTNEYICWQKPSGLFPLREDVSNVTITSVRHTAEDEVVGRKFDENMKMPSYKPITIPVECWLMSLSHPYLGKGQIKVTTSDGILPNKPEELATVIGMILKGNDLPETPIFQANLNSKLLHTSGCGHLPEPEACKPYGDLVKALEEGYSRCPLCFNQRLGLCHLGEELEIGKECEATIRHYNQISKDPALQNRVEKVGREVLQHWPLPLKGYHYRFSIVENDEFNATSCPGGYIFVYTGLINALESDAELEAVLAHEIAHIEQRHGIKENLKARRDANTAAIVGAVLGTATEVAIAAAHKKGAGAAGEAVATLSILLMETGAQIALYGYSREHEIEADVYALIYLQQKGSGRAPLLSVMKKMRSSDALSNPPLTSSSLDLVTHPNPKDRLFILNSLQCRSLTNELTFDGYSKDGELVYSIAVDGICTYKERSGKEVCKVLSEITTTAALGETKSIQALDLKAGRFDTEFRCDGPIDLEPMDTMGISFTREAAPNLSEDFIPRVDGISAQKVVKRTVSPVR
jgi:Zn-dependent protease with chaperone function